MNGPRLWAVFTIDSETRVVTTEQQDLSWHGAIALLVATGPPPPGIMLSMIVVEEGPVLTLEDEAAIRTLGMNVADAPEYT